MRDEKKCCRDCTHCDWDAYYSEEEDDYYEYAFCDLNHDEFDYYTGMCSDFK